MISKAIGAYIDIMSALNAWILAKNEPIEDKRGGLKMKKVKLFITTMLLTAVMSVPAWAGEWRSDSHGWWYAEDDGSYPVSQWREINGKHYYFGADGYMLAGTTTPDGYQVGADGAWIPDTQNGSAVMPYAWIIDQYKGSSDFKAELVFKKEDLQDRGGYYELADQEILRIFYNGVYDENECIYKGNVCFYKTAKTYDGKLTFEDAINKAGITRGNTFPMEAGYYYWTLWTPDEKGYFTMFAMGYSG